LIDAVVRRAVDLDHIEVRPVGDRLAGGIIDVEVGLGAAVQFSALAKMRAVVVLPVPRGPTKR
jgi:hypothetical protein